MAGPAGRRRAGCRVRVRVSARPRARVKVLQVHREWDASTALLGKNTLLTRDERDGTHDPGATGLPGLCEVAREPQRACLASRQQRTKREGQPQAARH